MLVSKRFLQGCLLVGMAFLLVACGSTGETDDTTSDTADTGETATETKPDSDAMTFTVTSVGGVNRTITDADALYQVITRDNGSFNLIFRDSERDIVVGLNFAPDVELAVGEFVFDDTVGTPVAGSLSAVVNDDRVTGATESGTVTFTEIGNEASGEFELVFSFSDESMDDATITGTFANIPLPADEE